MCFCVLLCHLFAGLEGTCLTLPSPAHLWGWTAMSAPRLRAKMKCAKGLSSTWGLSRAPRRWGFPLGRSSAAFGAVWSVRGGRSYCLQLPSVQLGVGTPTPRALPPALRP